MNTIFSKTFKTNRGIHGLLYNSTLCYMAVDSVVISCLLLIQLSPRHELRLPQTHKRISKWHRFSFRCEAVFSQGGLTLDCYPREYRSRRVLWQHNSYVTNRRSVLWASVATEIGRHS